MVTIIPGSEELFTIEKYKKELAKPYSKLDFYLCRTSDFSVGNLGPLSALDKTESTASASPAIVNNTHMHEGEPEETSLSELDACLNQNNINVSENASLNTQPMQRFPGFLGENSSLVSGDQIMDSVPGPSGHNSMDRKNYCKVFCPRCSRKFPVTAINEHADACSDRQTTPTVCITSEDECENLEENDSQTINHISLSRNDIAAIISSAVNNDCCVINDFSIKLNIRRGFYFEDFVSESIQ